MITASEIPGKLIWTDPQNRQWRLGAAAVEGVVFIQAWRLVEGQDDGWEPDGPEQYFPAPFLAHLAQHLYETAADFATRGE